MKAYCEKVINHKGLACWIKPITCQEGFCQGCQIYLDHKGKSISSSIYPIDSLKKQIQTKRAYAFSETCCGNREHKLIFQGKVDTCDEILELIDKGEK